MQGSSHIAWAVSGAAGWAIFGTGWTILALYSPPLSAHLSERVMYGVAGILSMFTLFGAAFGLLARVHANNFHFENAHSEGSITTMAMLFWGTIAGAILSVAVPYLFAFDTAAARSWPIRIGIGVVEGFLATGLIAHLVKDAD